MSLPLCDAAHAAGADDFAERGLRLLMQYDVAEHATASFVEGLSSNVTGEDVVVQPSSRCLYTSNSSQTTGNKEA